VKRMEREDFHVSDQDLVLSVDGELASNDEVRVQNHLAACWTCRARKLELENSIAAFIRAHREELDPQLPSSGGPRALLKARIAELAAAPEKVGPRWHGLESFQAWLVRAKSARSWLGLAAAVAGLVVLTFITNHAWAPQSGAATLAVPNPKLTPGAAVLVDRGQICSVSGPNNKAVPAALQRRVFEAYGLVHAQARAYEVDYLITPALGGADDIRNLWPQSYFNTVWNAQVKDKLEDHLRELVCDERLDLATAQHEIATNWIEAYKKYFHTDRP
jgi:anti-sigma factor RsiW